MAITSYKDVRRQVDQVYNYRVKDGETIPEGALVTLDANGMAVNATADGLFVGVANGDQYFDEDGNLVVAVWTDGIITAKTSATISQATLASPYVKVADNETFAAATGTDAVHGQIVKVIDANTARVRILVKK